MQHYTIVAKKLDDQPAEPLDSLDALAGFTAWLGSSIDALKPSELADKVAEFLALKAEGKIPKAAASRIERRGRNALEHVDCELSRAKLFRDADFRTRHEIASAVLARLRLGASRSAGSSLVAASVSRAASSATSLSEEGAWSGFWSWLREQGFASESMSADRLVALAEHFAAARRSGSVKAAPMSLALGRGRNAFERVASSLPLHPQTSFSERHECTSRVLAVLRS